MNQHEHEPSYEARPAAEGEVFDLRRLEVAANRFGPRIAEGIQFARDSRREITPEIARCIGHVLGRAFGRDSELAEYGRTGEGTSITLCDEYLTLYNSPDTHPAVKEWIDWFGTHLIAAEGRADTHWARNEYLPPKLDRTLVATALHIEDDTFDAYVPATLDTDAIDALTEDLRNLSIPQDPALQAFLRLPDVDASTPMLMESFHENFVGEYASVEDAGHELCELDGLEEVIEEALEGRNLPDSAVTIDYGLIHEHILEAYDLVEWKGRVYVFNK